MFNKIMDEFCQKLTEACTHYEHSAPTVTNHCNELFVRINGDTRTVSLYELRRVAQLWEDSWLQANYAANQIYKLRYELGMGTTGYAGF